MTKQKQARAKRYSQEYWQGEISNLNKSGMAVAAYGKEYGVPAERLYKWRRRIKAECKPKKKNPGVKKFVEIPVKIGTHPTEERYDIYVGPGAYIRIGSCFNPETVKQLIELLRRQV